MKQQNSKEVSKTFKIIKEEINEILKVVKKHIIFLSFFIFFLIATLVVIFGLSKLYAVIILLVTFLLLGISVSLSEKIRKAKKYKYKPSERFTKKNEVGDIFVNESRIHQAIIYLSLVEDEIWG